MRTTSKSYCRICSNGCAIDVDIEAGRAVAVHGDRDNPLYEGFTCVKGRAIPRFLDHPDRLLHSLMRVNGEFVPVPLDDAIDDIATKLETLVDRYGPNAIAAYPGMYAFTNPMTNPMFVAFMAELGSEMWFTPQTTDKPGKAIARAMHGSWMAPPQGFDDPDVVLLVGVNPIVTYGGGAPWGNPARWIRDEAARGMKLIVIDPRRSDVAKRAFLHLQPRPGTDTQILAAMLRVIVDEARYDVSFAAENVSGLEELRAALRPFSPVEVARFADVDPDDLVLAARTFADGARGFAVSGTGPHMAAPGTLVEYLTLCLDTLCGHWLREGELVQSPGALTPNGEPRAQADPPKPAYGLGYDMRTRGLTKSAAGLPTTALADEMLLEGERRIRALISCGGNPVAAWTDEAKTIAALESLDLLVQIDPWFSQTAAYATHVIAPKISLEIPFATLLQDLTNSYGVGYGYAVHYAQYTPALVDPPQGSEVIDEWEFFYRLARRMNFQLKMQLPSGLFSSDSQALIDMERAPTSDEMLELLCTNSSVPLDEVKEHPGGAIFPLPDLRVAPKQPGWEGRLDVGNSDMMRDLADASQALTVRSHPPIVDEEYPFRLLCRRMSHVYNSSCNDFETNRGRQYNPAFMEPGDLDQMDLVDGSLVEIESCHGAIQAIVHADLDLRPGTISIAFGYGGHPDSSKRVMDIGSSTARLIANGDDFDRYSGQPRMSNIPVRVTPLVDVSATLD